MPIRRVTNRAKKSELPQARAVAKPKVRNAAIRLQNRLSGRASKTNNHFRRNRVNLPHQERRTLRDFISFRLPVFRRTALYNVTDVNVLPLQTHRFNHLREQLARATYVGQTLCIFIRSWPFANKHELRFRIAVTKHNLVPRLVQLAPGTFAKVFANFQQCIVLDLVDSFEKRWPGISSQRWLEFARSSR